MYFLWSVSVLNKDSVSRNLFGHSVNHCHWFWREKRRQAFKISHSILGLQLRTLFEEECPKFFQELFDLHCMYTLIIWPWPNLRLASAMPVCIRCAIPICTTPKPLYYTEATPTAFFSSEAKLLKISPLKICSSSSYILPLQEAKWIKKRQKIGTMDCSWADGQHLHHFFPARTAQKHHYRANVCTSLSLLLHSSRGALHFFLKRYPTTDGKVIQPKVLHCFLAKVRKQHSSCSHRCFHCKQKHIQLREVINKIIVCWHYFLSESSKSIA